MRDPAEQPLNRYLCDLADRYLAELVNDTSPVMSLRECSFHRDVRPLFIISPFEEEVQCLQKTGRLSVNEYAVAASFYRDVRVFAVSRGLFKLFRAAFFQEQRFRRRMLLASPSFQDKCFGRIYTLWWITSRYGTSLARWLSIGVAVVAVFALILPLVQTTTPSPFAAVLCSIETFSQASYSASTDSTAVRLTLLAERLIGMVYVVFGFTLLLPRFSMECSRTTPSSGDGPDSAAAEDTNVQ